MFIRKYQKFYVLLLLSLICMIGILHYNSYAARTIPGETGKIIRLTPRREAQLPFANFKIRKSSYYSYVLGKYSKARLRADKFPGVTIGQGYRRATRGNAGNEFDKTLGSYPLVFNVNEHTAPFGVFYDHAGKLDGKKIGIEIIFFPNKFTYANDSDSGVVNISRNFAQGFFYEGINAGYVDYRFYYKTKRGHRINIPLKNGVLSFGSLNGIDGDTQRAQAFLHGGEGIKINGHKINPMGWKYPASPQPHPHGKYTESWGRRRGAFILNGPGKDEITGEYVDYLNNDNHRASSRYGGATSEQTKVYTTDDRRNTPISRKYYHGEHTRTGTNITKYYSPAARRYVIGGRPNGLFPDTYGPGKNPHGHKYNPAFDWNSEFFLSHPYIDPYNGKAFPYDNIFVFGSGEGTDGGSAWAVLGSHMFYAPPHKRKKCVRIHYVDAKSGNEVRTPIRAGQAKLHWSNKSQKKYWITLKGYRDHWNKYSLGAAQEGFQLAKSSDKFGSRAKADAQRAHENLDSMNKDGRYTFTYKANGNCHNLYVFLTVPYVQPQGTRLQSQVGEMHKTLEERRGNKYHIVPGYPTPSNPNGQAPTNAAKTSYGSKHYAYLVWGQIPDRSDAMIITLPSIKYTQANRTFTANRFQTRIASQPYKHALVHIFDNIGFSNSDNNYRTTHNQDGVASDIAKSSSNNGKPNDKRYAYLYKIDSLGSIDGKVTNDPPVNKNYKSQQALNIILAEDGPNSLKGSDKAQYEGPVSQYARQRFAYRLRIRVGKDGNGKSLLPGINGTAKNGDTANNCSTDSWNKFNGHNTNSNSNNFTFWNHAYMNWRLQDFDMSKNSNDKHSIYNYRKYLYSLEAKALAKGSHKLNDENDTNNWDNGIKSDFHKFMQGPHTVTTTAETDHKNPFSQYIPLRIPMIHYNIYHYNYGNGSQNIGPSVVEHDGYNDTWNKHFKDKVINPTTTGNKRGWFMREWGFGYSGQPVKVPIIPQVPNNVNSPNQHTVNINRCGSQLTKGDLKTTPNKKLRNYQFAYKDSDYYSTHRPFERIVLGKNGKMKNSPTTDNSHDQKFYKPYVKPQMGMDYGRLIVDTGNKDHQFPDSDGPQNMPTRHGLRFWMEFKSAPVRWTPGVSSKTDNLKKDFANTKVRIRIVDPQTKQKLFQTHYPAKKLINYDGNKVIPVYVPVPKNGYKDDSGVLDLNSIEQKTYKKGDAIPLEITIKSLPYRSSKPYANYWDGIHYSDGYVATDDTITAKDFKYYKKNIDNNLGNSARNPESADSLTSKDKNYHNEITGKSNKATNQDTNKHSTRHVEIIQPERTIKYLTGNFAGRDDSADVGSGMSSKLQSLAKGNQSSSENGKPAQDPAVRIQREWMDVHQNNRKPYLVNLDSKKTYPIHQSTDTGAYDKVKINGNTYDLSDKNQDKKLKAKRYAAVYPATFKTGYGIRPDITVTYGGNVDSKNYLNNGTNMKFSFPSEWGTNGNTAEVDNQKVEKNDIEKDNGITNPIHEHDYSDAAHVGRSSHSVPANEKEHDASQHNHSIPSPAYDATSLGKTKHKYALPRQNHLISDSDVGGDLVPMMDLESSPTKYDNYKGSDSWPMAHKLDNAFDETLHDIYTGGSSVSIAQQDLKPAIPTTVGHATMNYTFPLQTLSNDGGKASKDGNSSTDMTGPKNQLQKVFTPVWLPLGYYQTVFEKAYSQTSRLGGNWFNFEIGRPDTAVAHMMLSDSNPEDVDSIQFKDMNDVVRQTKDGKLVSADEQLLDELSLQPVMTRQITKFNKAADFPNTGRSMSQDVLSNEKYHSSNYDWPWQTFKSSFIK